MSLPNHPRHHLYVYGVSALRNPFVRELWRLGNLNQIQMLIHSHQNLPLQPYMYEPSAQIIIILSASDSDRFLDMSQTLVRRNDPNRMIFIVAESPESDCVSNTMLSSLIQRVPCIRVQRFSSLSYLIQSASTILSSLWRNNHIFHSCSVSVSEVE